MKTKCFFVIGVMLAFGFMACDTGTGGGDPIIETKNPFIGTWTQDDSGGTVKVEITENTWMAKVSNVLYNSGTYAYSGTALVEWTVTNKGMGDEPVGGKGDAAIANGKLIVSSFSDANMNGTYSVDADPFKGTWTGMFGSDNVKIVAENGSFKEYVDTHGVDDLEEDYRGTYTYSENTVTLTITEVRESSGWVSYENSSEIKPPQKSFSGNVSENEIVFTGNMTLTKQ